MLEAEEKPLVVIAGASGFVGTHLLEALSGSFRVRALTRSRKRASTPSQLPGVEWKECDLFGMRSVEESLAGARCGIYLVHSMKPSSRLVQARFEELDLLLADNFSRAAAVNRLEKLVYVGGILPDLPEARMSRHLRSRLEVERILGARGVPLCALRAGIIVGPGGSSIRILVNLVRHLRLMLLPKWSRSPTRPLAVRDLCRAVARVLEPDSRYVGSFDLGGPDRLDYGEMILRTAGVMGLRRRFIRMPVHAIGLSALWVRLVSRSPAALVNPLLESLRHPMELQPNALQDAIVPGALPFDQALEVSLEPDRRHLRPNPREFMRASDERSIKTLSRVRSIQRLARPADWDARKLALFYFGWIPRFLRPLVRTEVDENGDCRFFSLGLKTPLLQLRYEPENSTADRQLYWIEGGWLAAPMVDNRRARFEFRDVPGTNETIAAIHDFLPALPWWFYTATQAQVHAWVMWRFRRHLRRTAD